MPISSEEAAANAKRQKRLLLSSAVLTTITCVLVGSYLYRSQAAPYDYVNPAHRISTKAEIAQMKQDDIARARLIRGKWRSWVEAHQNLLRKLHRNKGEEATLQAFVEAVPGDTVLVGKLKPGDTMQVTGEDLGRITFGATPFPPEELSRLSRQTFAWTPFAVKGWKEIKWTTRDGKPTNPSVDLAAGQNFALRKWRRTLAENGDVAIAEAVSPMEPRIILWASGRITALQKYDGDAQGRLDTPANNPEIEPVYEFLR